MNKFLVLVVIVVGALLWATVAIAEQVVVGPTMQKSIFKPAIEAPKIFTQMEMETLKGYFPNHPGVAETFFITKPLYKMCQRPRAFIAQERLDRMALVKEKFDCFMFAEGDVERLRSKHSDLEKVRYKGREYFLPRDSTIMVLNGKFKDNISIPRPSKFAGCDRCSFDKSNQLTTCDMNALSAEPSCNVIRYSDMNTTIIWGRTYQRSLGVCDHYVEGTAPLRVLGANCSVVAKGDGKINANCTNRFAVDARAGDHEVFVSNGDGFVMADHEDTIYAGKGVNLLFIDNKGGQSKVIVPEQDMPCMRIIQSKF